jgi:hypothetical protein
MSSYLQIIKNRDPHTYNYSVLKGDELYDVMIKKGEKIRWRYLGKVDRKKHSINGDLIKNPPIKTIVILQRILKPMVKESFIGFGNWKSLNEVNFERGQDPIKAMDLGFTRIPKKGEEFTIYDRENKKYIKAICITNPTLWISGPEFQGEHYECWANPIGWGEEEVIAMYWKRKKHWEF